MIDRDRDEVRLDYSSESLNGYHRVVLQSIVWSRVWGATPHNCGWQSLAGRLARVGARLRLRPPGRRRLSVARAWAD